MIKNCRTIAAALLVLTAGACARAGTQEPRAFQGLVELDTVTLAFEVAGRVAGVEVNEGDRLAAGARIARLDDALVVPERSARAAELAAVRAELALLEAGARHEDVRATAAELESLRQQEEVLARQRARQAKLAQSGAVPSAELDVLESQASALAGRRAASAERLRMLRGGARAEELTAARARVSALEAGLAAIDARLARHVLSYDRAADVLDVHVEPGEVVGAGAPVVTVADLTHPYVDVFVPQGELAGIAVGVEAQVRVDAVAQALRGQVERVGTQTEFTPRYLFSEKERANLVIRVRVRVEDRERALHAGVPSFVSFARRER